MSEYPSTMSTCDSLAIYWSDLTVTLARARSRSRVDRSRHTAQHDHASCTRQLQCKATR